MEEKTESERRQPFDVAEAVTEGAQTWFLTLISSPWSIPTKSLFITSACVGAQPRPLLPRVSWRVGPACWRQRPGFSRGEGPLAVSRGFCVKPDLEKDVNRCS